MRGPGAPLLTQGRVLREEESPGEQLAAPVIGQGLLDELFQDVTRSLGRISERFRGMLHAAPIQPSGDGLGAYPLTPQRADRRF
jgi:hypothetical protein